MVSRLTFKISALFLLLFMTAVSQLTYAARITVDIDRTILEEGESFNVEFSSDGSVDGEPDFTVLDKDFRFLSQSQSSNIQFINGRMSSQKQWQLILMPKKTGKVVIPAINFGKDKSKPTAVIVKKTSANNNNKDNALIFIETEATPKTAYIQSQIIFTMRIYHAISLVNASLSEVHLSDKNAIIEKLGDDISYEKRIKGNRYKVFEKRFAIFPQQSGELKIDPVEFEGQYINNRRMLQSKFIQSDPITIEVKMQPDVQSAKASDRWLPSTNIKIDEQWSADLSSIKVGEPITRTITITAEGILGAQLPELTSGSIEQIKQYPDQPQVTTRKTKTGVIGIRQDKIAYIPTKSGKFRLPGIEIPWWNTQKDRQEIARIPSYEMNVKPGAKPQSSTVPPADPAPIILPQTDATTSTQSNVENELPSAGIGLQTSTEWQGNYWFWISIIFITLWLATLSLYWRQKLSTKSSLIEPGKRNTQNVMALERKLRQACNRDDAEAVKLLLLEWASAVWPTTKPMSLGEFSRRCDPQLSIAVDTLGRKLYGNIRSSTVTAVWNGPDFWKIFDEHKPVKHDKASAKATNVLQPMFQHST